VAYNSASTRHPAMAAALFIAARSLTFGKLADVPSEVIDLRVDQFLIVGRHSPAPIPNNKTCSFTQES